MRKPYGPLAAAVATVAALMIAVVDAPSSDAAITGRASITVWGYEIEVQAFTVSDQPDPEWHMQCKALVTGVDRPIESTPFSVTPGPQSVSVWTGREDGRYQVRVYCTDDPGNNGGAADTLIGDEIVSLPGPSRPTVPTPPPTTPPVTTPPSPPANCFGSVCLPN